MQGQSAALEGSLSEAWIRNAPHRQILASLGTSGPNDFDRLERAQYSICNVRLVTEHERQFTTGMLKTFEIFALTILRVTQQHKQLQQEA
jgi:hypothetical protein